MNYKSLQQCLNDLEKNGHLIRIKEEVDPYLEMASIHLRVFEKGGPAILYENVKGSKFKAVSNLFGSIERSQFLFRSTLGNVKKMVALKGDPMKAIKQPFSYLKTGWAAYKALPKKTRKNKQFLEGKISDLPLIQCWPKDGGPFVTLPAVYTEDIDNPGVMKSNLGMYRIQLSGNDYVLDEEIGLHYQLHRGIGVHQTKCNQKDIPLKVSIFIGGPPSIPFSAVMPLPEGLSELTFAGALGGRRFRYYYEDGFCIASDADFVICGEVCPNQNKPEGPFGDHLGYYSLTHDFPLMKVSKVLYKKDAIWPFTVVGRPPQEDTSFGHLIHDITGAVIPSEIPGLHAVHAVDAAGVHPLLLAIGSERYTPYYEDKRPQEILTIANHILGFGQMSLAKYLIIAAKEDNEQLDIHNEIEFLKYILERVDWTRDVHFYTKTTIDTLDYSGTDLNSGSKVVIAAAGDKRRTLAKEISNSLKLPDFCSTIRLIMDGVIGVSMPAFESESSTKKEIELINDAWDDAIDDIAVIILCDDADFVAANVKNFLWATFTRSNPSHDIHGIDSFIEHKHWGCRGSLIIDARIKPHHAPTLEKDPEIEKHVDRLGEKGGSLYGLI